MAFISHSRFVQTLRRAPGIILDAILPPNCAICRDPVSQPATLCIDCWARLGFISEPLCAVCGTPFDTAPPGRPVCAECLSAPPLWSRARSALRYDDASRPLVLGFKHADRLHLATLLANWMAAAAGPLLDEAEILVPVPLHRWRLLARRYNQATILAHDLARHPALTTPLPVGMRALVRTRRTPSQGHMSAPQRMRNVQGAFSADPRHAAAVHGRRVLLIDDVLTSGATATACTRMLFGAGAASVDLLTLARVVRTGLAEPPRSSYLRAGSTGGT